MEYKNINGLSISEIEKEVGKGVQLVIVGTGSEYGKMASALAHMLASETFACIPIGTLPQSERLVINKQFVLDETKPIGSMDNCVSELIQNIRKSAIELKSIQQEDIFFEEKKKPYQEFKKKNKKLKGWQKKR